MYNIVGESECAQHGQIRAQTLGIRVQQMQDNDSHTHTCIQLFPAHRQLSQSMWGLVTLAHIICTLQIEHIKL